MPSWKKIIVSGSDASLSSLQITNLSNTVTSNVVYIDGSGNLSYGATGTVTSASYASTASYLLNYQAPFPFTGSAIITGSLAVTGSIYATDITSSLYGTSSFAETASFVTASNVFGPYGSNSIISSSYAATSSRSDITLSTQILVLNQSGYTITKGLVVHITASGNSSDIPRVISASYESDSFSANTLGIATENITNGSQGFVITEGVLTGIDTSLFQSGQLIYLGAQGTITGSAPNAPLHSVRLGQVIREQSNNGSIHVRVDNGYELGELHDVTDATTSSSYGDLLVKSGSLWISSTTLNNSYTISGSLTVTDNLIVQGSSSIQYITSSQLNIANNIISVNTINPTFRFGGLAVIDSGSALQTSGSMLFDSQNNQWIFVHQSAAAAPITSSVLIMGPQTFNNVGNETTLTTNRLTKATGGDLGEHISDSNITDTGTAVSINSNTTVTGSLTILQTSSANAFVVYDSNSDSSPFVIDSSGSVGMGYSTPSSLNTKLYVSPDISGFIGIWATGFNNHGIKGTATADNKAGIYGEHSTDAFVTGIGVHGRATYNDTPFTGQQWIGGKFEAAGDSLIGKNYSVQLKDGTEAAGKVLVSQDASGSANWSTRLSGSYEITGSLTVTGTYNSPTGNTIDSNALLQASLLYLSNNF